MNKKAISILLTAAMGVSVLAAGTVTVSAAEKKDKYVIGMSQCNLGEPWRVAMNDQIAMAAEKHPEFEVIFADAAQDNSKQIADIENFVQMGVDLIITSPNEATPLTNAVSAAYDAGIPVILLDRKIDGDKYTQFIGADNVDMGRIAGEYIADTLLPDGGKVCEIKGLEGTSGGIDRDNGFREGIKKNDKIEIVAVNNADWLREKAITVAEEMLQTNDEIDLFLALNDPMAEGAYIAAKNAGREGDILFVGFDEPTAVQICHILLVSLIMKMVEYKLDGGMIVSVVRKLWQKKLKSWRVLNYQMQSIMTILKIRWILCWTILWIK